jgi:hypothetical protein
LASSAPGRSRDLIELHLEVSVSPIVQTAQTLVDVTARVGIHPDIARRNAQRANRLGHICRWCHNPGCDADLREGHEREFATAESSSLLSTAAYFACPACGGDERTAPACRCDGDDLRDLHPLPTGPYDGFPVGHGPGRRAAA